MKLRISMKTVLWIWGVLLVLIVALGYNAYNRLKPEAFIQLAQEELRKNIADAELVVGDVDYGLSTDFNIKLKNITILKNQTHIAKIGEFELKVPWWLLITHKGNAHISIAQVEFLISGNDVKKITHSTSETEGEKTEIKIEIPDYLANAEFTLRAKDVFLKNEDASRTYLQLSKLLVREFSLGKNSAFEIKLPIWFEYNGQSYSSEVWLFGDMTPSKDKWILNYTGDFRTKDLDAKINFDDVALEGKINLLLPQFAIEAQNSFMIEKEEKGSAAFKLNGGEWNLDLDFTALPLEFLSLFEKEIVNDYLTELKAEAAGKITLTKKIDHEELFMNGDLSWGGELKNLQFIERGTWRIAFNNNLWKTSFEGTNFKFSRENLIAFNETKFLEIKETYQFIESPISNIKFFVPTLPKVVNSEIPITRVYELVNVAKGNTPINGTLEYSSNENSISYSGELKNNEEFLSFKMVRAESLAIDFESKKFKMASGLSLFEPWITGEGLLDFKFSGRELDQPQVSQWKFNGEIELGELRGLIPSYLDEVWNHFNRKPRTIGLDSTISTKVAQITLTDLERGPAVLKIDLGKNREENGKAFFSIKGMPKKNQIKKIPVPFFRKEN